jgi:PAS domain S-box-containing protein
MRPDLKNAAMFAGQKLLLFKTYNLFWRISMDTFATPKSGQAITDFRAFEARPGVGVILLPNPPLYTLVAVSNDFITAAGMDRKDVIGKGHFDVFPRNPEDTSFTGEQNLKASFEYVINSKIPHNIPLQRYDIPNGDRTFSSKYWKIDNAPLLDDAGAVMYIIHTAMDITNQVLAEAKVEEGRGIQKAYNFFMGAPVIIGLTKGDNYKIELANEGLLEVWGRTEQVIGLPLLEAMPQLKEQGFIALLDNVRKTGEPFYASEHPTTLVRNGKEETLYINFIYKPYYEDEKETVASGVICVGHDVTAHVLARKKVAEISDRLNFRNALFEAQNAATPDGVLIVDPEGKMVLHNRRFVEIWHMPAAIIESGDDEAARQHAATILADPQGFNQRVASLYNSKKEKSFDQILFNDGRVIERTGTPITGEDGVYYGWAWYFRDITDKIRQEQKFRNVVEQAADPILILKGEELVLEVANPALLELWQVGPEALNKTFLEILPEMKDQVFVDLLKNVLRTGEPFYGTEVPAVFKRKNGAQETKYFNFSYLPYREANGRITGVLITASDVTGKMQATMELMESERNLRNTIIQSPVATCILRGDIFVVEVANDRMYELWGKNAEEMAQRPLFEGLPEAANQGFEELLRQVYTSGQTFNAKERPVLLPRDGRIQTVYVNFVYQPIWNADKTVSGIIAVAIDVTEQVLARQKIEEVVAERTKQLAEANDALLKSNQELKHSNNNLEEFAYAASHDLKEPVRKISFFADLLRGELKDILNEKQTKLFERMLFTTVRMNTLIEDLLGYSQVIKGVHKLEEIDLNKKVDLVMEDLELEILQTNAKITVDPLPVINGNKRQLQQLFQNLISNAIKYVKPGAQPEVFITSRTVTGSELKDILHIEDRQNQFHLIEVKDNGIGFEQQDAERIFTVFTRLHGNAQYKGTGVGLTIARKVVENHHGYIWGESLPGKSTSFFVLLPVE